MTDHDIICEKRGAAGTILLNRPKALNALTDEMVHNLASALDAWEHDPAILRIVIRGAGDRAFCAGGDIRRVYDLGMAGDHAAQLRFWGEEYLLNRRIARYSKPYVALMDGFVMGGGAGVAIHGSHRVAGDRLVFAMPEVSIGFFPDVGATFFLSHLAGEAGTYLAMTGAQIEAGDACRLGLATAYVPSARFDELAKALTGAGDTDAILAGYSVPAPPGALAAEDAVVARCFAGGDPLAILAALDAEAEGGSDFAAAAAAILLRSKSPTSVTLALRQMRAGRSLDLEAALTLEFRIVSRICRMPDLYSGIRAALIDRDKPAVWTPAQYEEIDPAVIEACFAVPDGGDLLFPEREKGAIQ